ncbi:hypothetical protein [Nocardia jiangsuensis]|uniref:Uncharacterized protein n=1 Tax=Nocardia jiangsuensis TaxID=1691563 RepID=A0ABV8DVK6_9NOCA
MSAGDTKDIRDLLGMHTTGARVMVGAYVLLISVVTVATWPGMRTVWPTVLSLVVLAVATVALIAVPGDPLPLVATVAMTLAGPFACAVTLVVVPVPMLTPLQAWTHGGATTIYCFMCVRGRSGFAWLGILGVTLVYMAWTGLTGQGAVAGFGLVAIEIGPLGMATVLSYTLRPNAQLTFELRDAARDRYAEESAAAATMQERDLQVTRLDRLTRPLLTRIADGTPLTERERLECELLEAHLRDSLRAPGLSDEHTTARVRAARSRGVEVVLIDDRGMAESAPEVGERVREAVVAALDATADGSVRIRILPPGRPTLASILVRAGADVRRTEYDHAGLPAG